MSHEMYSTCSTQFQIRKDGVIQTSPVVAINKLKGPLTWLKVATTWEKPPTRTQGVDTKYSRKNIYGKCTMVYDGYYLYLMKYVYRQ